MVLVVVLVLVGVVFLVLAAMVACHVRTRRHPSLSLFQPMDTITAAIHSRQHQHRHKKVVTSKQRQTSLTCLLLLVSRRRPRRRG